MAERQFSVLISCCGFCSDLALRAVNSVIDNSATGRSEERRFDLHVAAADTDALDTLRELLDKGCIDTLLQMQQDVHECRLRRLLIDAASTEYALWFSQDSRLLEGWEPELLRFIEANRPFDVAAKLWPVTAVVRQDPVYLEFLRSRSWYVNEELENCDGPYIVGGMHIFRPAFLLQHNFPDRAMLHDYEDGLLGDLLWQQKGRLVGFPPALLEKIKIMDVAAPQKKSSKDCFLPIDPPAGN